MMKTCVNIITFCFLLNSILWPSCADAQVAKSTVLGIQLEKSATGRFRVSGLIEGTPAADAGLQNGDEILFVNNRHGYEVSETVRLIDSSLRGTKIELKVFRDGELKTLMVPFSGDYSNNTPQTIDARDNSAPENVSDTSFGYLGVSMSETPTGFVKFGTVVSDSPAEAAGLQPEDMLLRINNNTLMGLNNTRDFIKSLKPGSIVQIDVIRAGEVMKFAVNVGTSPATIGLQAMSTNDDSSQARPASQAPVRSPTFPQSTTTPSTSTIDGSSRLESADVVTVEVVGIGKDAEAAEKNALYQAVEQAVGAYVDNETVVKNEEVIYDKLLTVAQGFVQSFDVLSVAKERRDGNGIWEIKIKAIVKKSEVGAALRSAGVMQVAADGTSAWAAQITKLKSREDAMALLEKVIPEIPRNLVVCKILQEDGQIQTQEDPKTGDLLAVVDVGIAINLEWWHKEAVPALDAAFTALQLSNSRSDSFEVPFHYGQLMGPVVNGKVEFHESLKWNHRFNDFHLQEKLSEIHNYDFILNKRIVDMLSSFDMRAEAQYSVFHLNKDMNYTSKQAQFVSYGIPENYHQKIVKLINSVIYGREEYDVLPYGTIEPVFTINIVGEDSHNLQKADFFFPNRLEITAPYFRADYQIFNPLFLFKNLGEEFRTDSFSLRIKIPVTADVIKQTKAILINAGKYGISK